MIFGDPRTERIQVNEGTAWSGSVLSSRAGPVVTAGAARQAIADARTAIAAGDYVTADAAVRRLQHRHSQAYLPFADLCITLDVDAVTDYERRLDLDTATHETRYRTADGTLVRQVAFASYPDRVLVFRVETDRPVELDLALTSPLRILDTEWQRDGMRALALQLPSDVAPTHAVLPPGAEPIAWDPSPGASLRGAIAIGIQRSGIRRDGTRTDLIIGTATTFDGIAQPPRGDERTALDTAADAVEQAMLLGADELHKRHVADYQSLFRRVRWEAAPAPDEPTDERLLTANAHPGGALAADPGLAPLLFDYGRYLLISSSRAGGTPANLQGIWNDLLPAPWSANYTTNINTQMNYWPADVANLPECLPPLVDLIAGLSRTGTETARRLYDAPGWVAHHNADIWGYSQPVGHGQDNPKWAFWPMGGVWLANQLLDHLSFGARSFDADSAGAGAEGARSASRETAWPLIRSAAEFLLAWLLRFDDGTAGTAPSTSPENEFYTGTGAIAAVARSSTMDLTLAAALLRGVIELGPANDPIVVQARTILPLTPFPIRNGRGTWADDSLIPEWQHNPVATEPNHRHQSHLWFVYPGTGPLPADLAAAASRSLDARGDESTGWSLAWRIALRARLRQPEAVGRLLRLFFRDIATGSDHHTRGPQVRGEGVVGGGPHSGGPHSGGLYPNLFSAHPPFQIDANFGYVAAVAECLVHSHADEIALLPAVPAEFGAGSITGLVTRPGIEVDLNWDATGSLRTVRLRPLTPAARARHRVSYREGFTTVDLSSRPASLDPGSFTAGRRSGVPPT
jgi:alpha-L-fucosidase 2